LTFLTVCASIYGMTKWHVDNPNIDQNRQKNTVFDQESPWTYEQPSSREAPLLSALKNNGGFIIASLVTVALIGGGNKILEATGNPLGVPTPQEQSADPIPGKNEPYKLITVKTGDTESAIAAREGHTEDYSYINMLNDQLPAERQGNRTLIPGDTLRVPSTEK
jgi:hypothetical protein